MREFHSLHHFWFGDFVEGAKEPQHYLKDRLKLWFLRDAEMDLRSAQYSDWLSAPGDPRLEDWKRTPVGLLSLVLLLDQIPRNCYRDQPKSFAYDGQALDLTLGAIHKGLDRELHCLERLFLYLPVQHDESREMQQLGVDLFTQNLETAAGGPFEEFLRICLEKGVQHKVVIDRFERFPHRNRILGRESTREEIDFLKLPGSSF